MLMEYIGWKDARSAMRYVDSADPFAQHRIEIGADGNVASTAVICAGHGRAPVKDRGADRGTTHVAKSRDAPHAAVGHRAH
jgi:hypothetical protein